MNTTKIKVDANVFDALRWVAQEARAAKMAGDVDHKAGRLREALDALEKAYREAE